MDKPPRVNLHDLNVHLKYGIPGSYIEEEISSIPPRYLKLGSATSLFLHPLLEFLQRDYFLTREYMVSCYSPSRDVYVFQGQTPLSPDLQLDLKELGPDLQLTLKVRFTSAASLEEEAERSKEWKIGHIIERVAKWRSLCTELGKGETALKSLEESAGCVGIPKKTLDDYLLQLRLGRKFGFNFEEHKHEGIGLLRAYVKKYRKIQNEVAKLRPTDCLPAEVVNLVKDQPSCKLKNCCLPAPGTFPLCPLLETLLEEANNAEEPLINRGR